MFKALILIEILFFSLVSRQNVIYTLGETFFNYTEHFKLYSAFCSSHSRVVELLQSGEPYLRRVAFTKVMK